MSQTILNVSKLVKKYGKTKVVNNISLTLEPGQIYGLLGPNGSGKTTTLHMVTGLIKPDSGTITIADIPIENKKSRNNFGFAPDDLTLPTSLTGQEFLEFHDAMRSINTKNRTKPLIEALHLDKAIHDPIAKYSHGMKRKIQLIAALSHQPKLLILDEPYRGLDPEAASILLQIIKSFTKTGRTVLMATHDMLRANRDCNHVTIINNGKTVSEGTPNNLIKTCNEAKTLEDVFMIKTALQTNKKTQQININNIFTPTQNPENNMK